MKRIRRLEAAFAKAAFGFAVQIFHGGKDYVAAPADPSGPAAPGHMFAQALWSSGRVASLVQRRKPAQWKLATVTLRRTRCGQRSSEGFCDGFNAIEFAAQAKRAAVFVV